MKNLSRLGLLLLMVALLVGAMILPRVMRNKDGAFRNSSDISIEESTGSPVAPESAPVEEAIEAETAVLAVDTSTETNPEPEDSTDQVAEADAPPVPDPVVVQEPDVEEELKPFFAAMEANDLDLAATALEEMESTVPAGMLSGLRTMLDSAAKKEDALASSEQRLAEVSESEPVLEDIDAKLEPLFALIEAGNLEQAKVRLESVSADLPAGMVQGLTTTIATAEANQIALAETEGRIEAIEAANRESLEESLKGLSSATEAAQLAAHEAQQMREELSQIRTELASNAAPPEPAPEVEPAVEIQVPPPISVRFRLNSSSLSDENKSNLDDVAEALSRVPGLILQLRGHADPQGDDAYNAMLSRARAETVKDHLLEKGVSYDRVEVIAFGSTQAEARSSEESRRVDLIYRVRR